jgi:hypothetical protein
MATWERQLREIQQADNTLLPGMTLIKAVKAMNKIVKPCSPLQKMFGIFTRDPHKFVDISADIPELMNFTALFRCKDCGILKIHSLFLYL